MSNSEIKQCLYIYPRKGLVTKKTDVEYKSFSSLCSKVISKDKVFEK